MKHSFTSTRGHSLEVRESGRSIKLFLSINKTFKRIDHQPLKPAIVTALLQEIIFLKRNLELSNKQSDISLQDWSVAVIAEEVMNDLYKPVEVKIDK